MMIEHLEMRKVYAKSVQKMLTNEHERHECEDVSETARSCSPWFEFSRKWRQRATVPNGIPPSYLATNDPDELVESEIYVDCFF